MGKMNGLVALENLTYNTDGINESRSGHKILGVLEGTHFVPGGYSRNGGRHYSEELWEGQLTKNESVKNALARRSMLGTMGHDSEITDKELREGIPSHITTELAIEKNGVRGYGKSEILDTPSGRILHAYLEAGVGLYVSSRADGSYSETKVTHPDGHKVNQLDPKTYQLERFDIVREPGFLAADPKLAESFDNEQLDLIHKFEESYTKIFEGDSSDKSGKKDNLVDPDDDDDNNPKEETNMGQKKDNEESSAVEAILKQNDELKLENTELVEKLKVSDEALIALKETSDKEKADDEKKKDDEKDDGKELEAFRTLGTPEEIKEALEASLDFSESVKALGTPEEIKEALVLALDFSESVKALGSPEEIKEALESNSEAYRELGTPEEIKEALELASQFFAENGTFKEVKGLIKESLENKVRLEAQELASQLNVDTDKVLAKLESNWSRKDITEFFAPDRGLNNTFRLSEDGRKKSEEKKSKKVETRLGRVLSNKRI